MTEPIFVDTSVLYAMLDNSDRSHQMATSYWDRLLDEIVTGDFVGITHYGVVLEATSLVQRRLGLAYVRQLADILLPALSVVWVTQELHNRSVIALLAADRRGVSLVDWTSFELMRSRGITHALAFDTHFDERGFTLPWG